MVGGVGAGRQDAATGSGESPDRVGRRRGAIEQWVGQGAGDQPTDLVAVARAVCRGGVTGLLKDAPRPGRRKRIRPEKVEAIVNATLHTTPRDATHWSVRSMAQTPAGESGDGASDLAGGTTCSRIAERPSSLSRDPQFVSKLRDIVGLYLNPPAKALVLSVDEKSQIQALDRTQPILPLRPGCRRGRPTITSGTARPRCSPPSTSWRAT